MPPLVADRVPSSWEETRLQNGVCGQIPGDGWEASLGTADEVPELQKARDSLCPTLSQPVPANRLTVQAGVPQKAVCQLSGRAPGFSSLPFSSPVWSDHLVFTVCIRQQWQQYVVCLKLPSPASSLPV